MRRSAAYYQRPKRQQPSRGYTCICGYTTTMNKWFMSHQAHCPQVRHERYIQQQEGAKK